MAQPAIVDARIVDVFVRDAKSGMFGAQNVWRTHRANRASREDRVAAMRHWRIGRTNAAS